MRIALAAALVLLTAACSNSSPTTTPPSTAVSTPPPTSSTPQIKVLTWGDSGTSSDVQITIAAPATSTKPVIGVDGKPDPTRKFIVLPITITNKAAGQATVTVSARIGQQKAEAYEDEGGAGKFLPGESGSLRRPFEVAADATGDLVLEVYANVDQQPTKNRLAFKGPLP